MTLTHETIFNSCSRRPAPSIPFDGVRAPVTQDNHLDSRSCADQDACTCGLTFGSGGVRSTDEWMRKRLSQLINQEITQLERGKNPRIALKRGKAMAQLARAIKDIATPDAPLGGSPPGGPDDGLADDPGVEADMPEPLGEEDQGCEPQPPLEVEAFRMALERELYLIRQKKENIP